MIFYRGSLASRQANPHCGDKLSWRGARSIGSQCQIPQSGVALSTQDKDPPSHAQSTRVSFRESPTRKDQEPLTRSLVWPRTISTRAQHQPLLQTV